MKKTVEKGLKQGRPARWSNCLDLAADIEMYFEWCEDSLKCPGIVQMCVFLDIHRSVLIQEYGKKEEFSAIIKKAQQRVEASLEDRLNANNVTGTIFNLKNNFGWKDRSEVQQDQSITVVRKTYGGDDE